MADAEHRESATALAGPGEGGQVPAPAGPFDVVIAGAGIAGCALATALANDGRRVLVLERDMTVPDTFRGELLQPGGLIRLQELGLGDCVNGIDAQPCRGYVVYKPLAPSSQGKGPTATTHEHVVIPYPGQEYHDGSERVASGFGFHHGLLVQNMRRRIAAHPREDIIGASISLVEGTAVELIEDQDAGAAVRGLRYNAKGASESTIVYAPLTVDCTGCFSKFRPQLSAAKPTYSSHFVALLLRDVELPYTGFGYVTLADPAPVLMYAIATNELRVLVGVLDPLPSSSNGDLERYLNDVVAPQLPSFVVDAFKRAVGEKTDPYGTQATSPWVLDVGAVGLLLLAVIRAKQRVRSVPCRSLSTEALRRNGVLSVGDALNMRHPLTGGGMTVALTDVCLLASLLKTVPDLNDHAAVDRATKPFFSKRQGTASTINILAQILFDVFCGASRWPALGPVREACFDYFYYFGTDCLALVSGLFPSPPALVCHFFAVAGFSVYQLLSPFPTPRRVWDGVRAFYASYKVIETPLAQHYLHQHTAPFVKPSN